MADISTGEALSRIEESLSATNVLSKDYTSHILAWAYKVASVAHDAGRVEGQGQAIRHLQEQGRTEAAQVLTDQFRGR